jgi:hypothetical protein
MISREMSQNDLSRNSNFWHGNQLTFDVPAGLGLLDEDFELPEERDSQSNNVEEVMVPTTQTQRQPVFPSTPRILPVENNNDRPFMDPYSPISPNDNNYSSPPAPQAYQPFSQHIPHPVPSDSRYLYLPTYMHCNPHMLDSEYYSKYMAEEDKRRRNTAASARFRIKKKMREQALERTAREMSTKAETLESRVKELEREIKWLKNLLIEKDPKNSNIQCSQCSNHHDRNNNDKNLTSKSDQQHQK